MLNQPCCLELVLGTRVESINQHKQFSLCLGMSSRFEVIAQQSYKIRISKTQVFDLAYGESIFQRFTSVFSLYGTLLKVDRAAAAAVQRGRGRTSISSTKIIGYGDLPL